jgi:tRNA-specific 2-thiouridylase
MTTPANHRPGRTLVALSGGVDSATAAALLAAAGEELVTVFMRNGVGGGAAARRSCCSLSDARDARAVADRLGLPFYVHDMSAGFARLIDGFVHDYLAGRTPNPCVVCNNDLKFGELLELADDLGCDAVASGHYARRVDGGLHRARDRRKDQSYLLHGLSPVQLARARFPLGELTKAEVRARARELGLPVADKPDSADICFVPGGDYRAVVAARAGHLGAAGPVLDPQGVERGRHAGVAAFTVGQRRGLGVALGEPAYVTAIDPDRGRVTLGGRDDLARADCRVGGLNWLRRPAPGAAVLEGLSVQLRHHHEPEPARVELEPDATRARVVFAAPSRAVTPGQYAVLYRGDEVLGGGRILGPADERVANAGAGRSRAGGAP